MCLPEGRGLGCARKTRSGSTARERAIGNLFFKLCYSCFFLGNVFPFALERTSITQHVTRRMSPGAAPISGSSPDHDGAHVRATVAHHLRYVTSALQVAANHHVVASRSRRAVSDQVERIAPMATTQDATEVEAAASASPLSSRKRGRSPAAAPSRASYEAASNTPPATTTTTTTTTTGDEAAEISAVAEQSDLSPPPPPAAAAERGGNVHRPRADAAAEVASAWQVARDTVMEAALQSGLALLASQKATPAISRAATTAVGRTTISSTAATPPESMKDVLRKSSLRVCQMIS